MAGVGPYLIFNGHCEEAVKLYCEIFNGEIHYVSKYSEAPMEVPTHWVEKVLHMSFQVRGVQVLASDSMPGQEVSSGNNVQLCLNFKKDEHIDDYFQRLASGGEVLMELQNTYWGARFGQLKDRFGVSWMFNQILEDI